MKSYESVKEAIYSYVEDKLKGLGLNKIIEIADIDNDSHYVRASDLSDLVEDYVNNYRGFNIHFDGEAEWLYDDGDDICGKILDMDEIIDDYELVKEEVENGYPNINTSDWDILFYISDDIVDAVLCEWNVDEKEYKYAIEQIVDEWSRTIHIEDIYDDDDDDIATRVEDYLNDMIEKKVDELYPDMTPDEYNAYVDEHFNTKESLIKFFESNAIPGWKPEPKEEVVPELNDLQRYVDLITQISKLCKSGKSLSGDFFLQQFKDEYFKNGYMGRSRLTYDTNGVLYHVIYYADHIGDYTPLLDLTYDSLAKIYTELCK